MKIRFLLIFLMCVASSQSANAGLKGKITAVGTVLIVRQALIRVGPALAQKAIKVGIDRLSGPVARVAKLCLQQHFGEELNDTLTKQVMGVLVDQYLGEIAQHNGVRHSDATVDHAHKGFSEPYRRLTPEENAAAKKPFLAAGAKDTVRDGWGDGHGTRWLEKRGENAAGQKIITRADIHHIKPTSIGGSALDWRNAAPLYKSTHQQGVHKNNGMLKIVVEFMKKRVR